LQGGCPVAWVDLQSAFVHVRVAFWVSKGTGVWWRAKEASSRGERKRDTSHFVGDDWNDAGGTATQEQLPKSGVRPDEG
jgi:hypothetical protein